MCIFNVIVSFELTQIFTAPYLLTELSFLKPVKVIKESFFLLAYLQALIIFFDSPLEEIIITTSPLSEWYSMAFFTQLS